jgi:hypothetical protein
LTSRLAWARRPAVIVAIFYTVVVVALLATHAWDPRFFATVGPQWKRHDPDLSKQSDGIIYYRYATDPLRAVTRANRYRAARILYPLVAHVLVLGRADRVGWSLVLINLVAIVLGTEIVHRLLERRGVSPWFALGYGGWCGLGLALLHGTAEPLGYLCALAGVAALERGRPVLAAVAFIGALLTRETTLLLVVPFLLLGSRERAGAARWVVPLAVVAAWAAWLGILLLAGQGSTGPWSTMWRLPLSGFRATRLLDLPATVVFLLGPALLVLGWAARELWRRPRDASLWAAALNALLVLWLPPETAHILWHSGRIATGLVGATLIAAPLASSGPRLWHGLTSLFAVSALWTVAVTLRYLFWDAAFW